MRGQVFVGSRLVKQGYSDHGRRVLTGAIHSFSTTGKLLIGNDPSRNAVVPGEPPMRKGGSDSVSKLSTLPVESLAIARAEARTQRGAGRGKFKRL